MSEGELKKLMRNVFKDFRKDAVDFLLKDFYEILDEAKKDFPTAQTVSQMLFKKYPNQVFNTLNIIQIVYEERNKWKKKWFGENKK